MKVVLTITVQLEKGMQLSMLDEREWAEEVVFVAGENLILHSNEIGDSVGFVTKVENFKWIDDGSTD